MEASSLMDKQDEERNSELSGDFTASILKASPVTRSEN